MLAELFSLGNVALLVTTGVLVGLINGVVGSGSLISFPLMVALGIPPIAANGSNAVGMLPGAISATWADRTRLKAQSKRLTPVFIVSLISALAGALLVIVLPPIIFSRAVPWLIWFSVFLVAFQPLLAKLGGIMKSRAQESKDKAPRALLFATVGTGAYGGYFGAAQGVLLLAVLGILDDPDLRRANGTKNLLTVASTSAASVVFIFSGHVVWFAAVAIGIGSLLGGWLGGMISQKLPKWLFQLLIIVVGVVAAVYIGGKL